MTVASRFAEFAAREAHGSSPAYEKLALAVARHPDLLSLLAALPPAKQQPNLLFAVGRLLGGPVHQPPAFLDFVTTHWPAVKAELLLRATQTNEPGRCAVLLPILAALPQPLALLEVGASAGLNLYPDRYMYGYSGRTIGTGGPLLDCVLTGTAPPETGAAPSGTGAAPPARLPEVVWRAGLDLNPLDVTDPADVAWLEALIWPEHTHRRARLRAAAAIAAADPPLLIRGDLVDDLPALAAQAPLDATLVVFHTSVLYQVPADRRAAFVDLASRTGRWISVEDPDVVTFPGLPQPPDATLHNVLALDGTPLAWAKGHGQAMSWFAPAA
jgi:hypothetical protein